MHVCACWLLSGTVVHRLSVFKFNKLSALSRRLCIAIAINLPLYLEVKLVRLNKVLYCSVATCLCYRVGWVVTTVNLLDIYKLAALISFAHYYNVNYKALLLSSAELN